MELVGAQHCPVFDMLLDFEGDDCYIFFIVVDRKSDRDRELLVLMSVSRDAGQPDWARSA